MFWRTKGFFCVIALGILVANLSTAYGWHEKSLTNQDDLAGKWLVTLSVGGGGMEASPTLALRNLLHNVFSTVQGGLYIHALDLDDVDNGPLPDRRQLDLSWSELQKSIAQFKASHPGAPTMVVIGLTGHGMTDDKNVYSFALAGDDYISGDEIVDLVQRLGVDETLLLVQSCQSGALPWRHFSAKVLSKTLEGVQNLAKKEGLRLAVITPVSQYIDSPVMTWEEILAKSFSAPDADINGDNIVTFEEWKNVLLQQSYLSGIFAPTILFDPQTMQEKNISPPDYGIDVQFFDALFPADSPLLLTGEGIARYATGELKISSFDHSRTATLFPATLKMWKEESEFTLFLYRNDLGNSEIVDRFSKENELHRKMMAKKWYDLLPLPAAN